MIPILNSHFVELVSEEIKNDPNIINKQDPEVSNKTYINAACTIGSLDICKFLLDKKADIYIADENSNNCLQSVTSCAVQSSNNGNQAKLSDCYLIIDLLFTQELKDRFDPKKLPKLNNEPFSYAHKAKFNCTVQL